MPYIEPKTSTECASRLLALAKRLQNLKDSGPYSDEDARGLALSNCRITCLGTVMVLNILALVEERGITGEEFKKLVGMTSGTVQMAGDILDKQQKLGFLVIFQFQVENLFMNLLREIESTSNLKGFRKIAKEIISLLSLPDSDRKLEILNTSALIRNSLHSNGIHHGYKSQSSKISLDGCEFEFNHLQKVTCAGWGHIILSCNESVSVIEDILNTSSVRELKDPIMDQYAWEEATKP